MKQAVQAVEKGTVSVRKAAELYNVPRSTLHDKASGKTAEDARSGPQPYLSPEEEEELTSFLPCPEICTMTRSPIHFYYRLIRLAPISNYKQCTSMVQATYKLFAATVTVVTGVF